MPALDLRTNVDVADKKAFVLEFSKVSASPGTGLGDTYIDEIGPVLSGDSRKAGGVHLRPSRR